MRQNERVTDEQNIPEAAPQGISEELKEHYAQLIEQVRASRQQYYVDDAPTISDAAYDAMYRELEELEALHPEIVANDSPTQEVGGEVSTAFAPVVHLSHMYSLEDVFSIEELKAGLKKLKRMQPVLRGRNPSG